MILGAPNASWELRSASRMLLASDVEALEVSGAPRGDQESAKKAPSHDPSALSIDYELASSRWQPPKSFPRSLSGAKMKLKETQKSSTEALKSSENDLKIKNVNVHKTIE